MKREELEKIASQYGIDVNKIYVIHPGVGAIETRIYEIFDGTKRIDVQEATKGRPKIGQLIVCRDGNIYVVVKLKWNVDSSLLYPKLYVRKLKYIEQLYLSLRHIGSLKYYNLDGRELPIGLMD